MKKALTFTFPWPPSVNNYWMHTRRGIYISAFGRAYRKEVWTEVKSRYPGHKAYSTPIEVSIVASPPDKRKRDLDNIFKSILDAMQHAGVYEDDGYIDLLQIARIPEKHGLIHVTVREVKK